jgi:acid phosphatase family membrane protein YuiD
MIAATAIKSLFGNIIFLSTITSLCVAQVLKMIVYLIINKHKNLLEAIFMAIWRTGGMPSSHSAIVLSLATSTALWEGIDSDLFAFSLIFTLVVLRDALGVRRAAGLQAKAINTLGKQVAEKTGIDFKTVKEIQGHTPLEVLVGAVLGVLIAVGYYLFLKA